MIRVERVTHHFGAYHVLRDVSFHVRPGDIFGFIGPNGAGKTTTLRMIATLLEPDSGHIFVDGVDVVDEPAEVRRRLGFMPDSFGVYERITVREYLEFFAAAHELPFSSRARAVQAVTDLVEIGAIEGKLVGTLSKGMKQRVGIARMLLHDPRVLILDEPANGLDPRARIEMRALIEELQRLGKTIVLSSHILTELSDMVSNVCILERGRIVVAGPVDEIARTLRPERSVRLRLLAPPEGVEATLAASAGVVRVARAPDGDFEVVFQGGEEAIAALVTTAVGAGLRIVRVEPSVDDLERIFLEVTKGELQ